MRVHLVFKRVEFFAERQLPQHFFFFFHLLVFGNGIIGIVQRFKNNLPLNQPKFELFYTAGAEGYVDYPAFHDVQIV